LSIGGIIGAIIAGIALDSWHPALVMPLITLSPLALIFSGFYVSEDEGYRRRKFNVLKVLK